MHASTLEKRATTDPRVEEKGRKEEEEEEEEVPKEGGIGREGGGGRGRKSDRGERRRCRKDEEEGETDRYFFKGIEFHEVFLFHAGRVTQAPPAKAILISGTKKFMPSVQLHISTDFISSKKGALWYYKFTPASSYSYTTWEYLFLSLVYSMKPMLEKPA